MKSFVSKLSGQSFPLSERVKVLGIREPLRKMMSADCNGELDDDDFVALSELNGYRQKYITGILQHEIGELNALDRRVVDALNDHSILSGAFDGDANDTRTLGQRVADKVASFGGSWTFILSFMSFLILWIILNAAVLLNKGFDPYPFILLNLILSCVAAIQAPIIMMSQNRQEEKDREKARQDYMINLKSELEIRFLHEKIDHLIMHQQQELLEVQNIQLDMMNDILNRINVSHEKKS